MKKVLLLFGSTLLLTACATQGQHLDQSRLSSLKPGVTTIADAEALLGKPQSVTRRPNGTTILGYGFSSVQTDGKSMIPVVGYFVGKGTTSSVEYTGLNFDQSGHYLNSTSFQQN